MSVNPGRTLKFFPSHTYWQFLAGTLSVIVDWETYCPSLSYLFDDVCCFFFSILEIEWDSWLVSSGFIFASSWCAISVPHMGCGLLARVNLLLELYLTSFLFEIDVGISLLSLWLGRNTRILEIWSVLRKKFGWVLGLMLLFRRWFLSPIMLDWNFF